MTPSAARGLIEAVLWKPALRWRVERIRVLNPVRFTAFRRNEVNHKAPRVNATVIRDGGSVPPYFIDDLQNRNRAQRNTVALCDVDYVIDTHFELTEHAGAEDNIPKFEEMFRRRVEKGQHFHQPYLGCREFAADVLSAEGAPAPIPETRDLGRMLWDIVYHSSGNRALFFDAKLDNGILHVPATIDEVG